MAGLEINNASSTVCRMCGTAYGKLNGYFYKSYAQLYRGVGYLPICKGCLDFLYDSYLAKCNSPRDAVRQVCRKLDLYWDEGVYSRAEKDGSARTIMSAYLTKVNVYKNTGKSYDDTLEKENALWNFANQRAIEQEARESSVAEEVAKAAEEDVDVSEDIKQMWGTGYTNAMYNELEQRRQYWMGQLIEEGVDVNQVGVQALLRQIVSTELDINRGRAAGLDVDKKVNTFNTLLGSAVLKPSQQKGSDIDTDIDKTPLGVWAWRYEHKRPLPEIDEDFKDINGIRKYITIWLKGHLAKMVGLRNSYSQMYEDEIKRLSVDKIDYEDDTDDSFLADLFDENGADSS